MCKCSPHNHSDLCTCDGTPPKKAHKHAELIKAWADGERVQIYDQRLERWDDLGSCPCWVDGCHYRIKPEPKPDSIRYLRIERSYVMQHHINDDTFIPGDNVRATFDGETGKLKSVELI